MAEACIQKWAGRILKRVGRIAKSACEREFEETCIPRACEIEFEETCIPRASHGLIPSCESILLHVTRCTTRGVSDRNLASSSVP